MFTSHFTYKVEMNSLHYFGGRRGRDRMVVRFITTYVINTYHH